MRLDSILLRSAGRPVMIDRLYGTALITRLTRSHDGFLKKAMRVVGLAGDDAVPDRLAASAMAPMVTWAQDPVFCSGFTLVGNVAIIDVKGVLTQEGYFDYWDWCWFGGYDQIVAAIKSARADERVKAILLRVSSPGGLVDGLFELCNVIREGSARSGGKPIWAHCDLATSAAYAIACSCDRVVALSTAYVANIGVYMLHHDFSAWMKETGIAITEIVNDDGDHKTDFQDYKPLSEGALADARANVNEMARLFRECVTAGRGISDIDIRAQKSRAYLAHHSDASRSAMALKLVDAIATEQTAADELQKLAAAAAPKPANPAQSEEDQVNKAKMKTVLDDTRLTDAQKLTKLRGALAEGEGETVEETDEERKKREEEEAAKAKKDGETDDADAAAKKRTADALAVFDLPEAKGRQDLARACAKKVGAGAMTVADAKEMLAASPKASRLDSHMQGRDADVGANGGGEHDAGKGLAAAVDKAIAKAAPRK